MNKKKVFRVSIILWVIGFISFFENKEFHIKKVYYNTDLNSKIINIENNISGGRSYDYITKTGKVITLMNNDTLFVANSVGKSKKNWIFKLYRKNEFGEYKFIWIYNLDK